MIHEGDVLAHCDMESLLYVKERYNGGWILSTTTDGTGNQAPWPDSKMPGEEGSPFQLVSCGHGDHTNHRAADEALKRSGNVNYNLGVLDGALREVSWVLRNLVVNSESMTPERVRSEASQAIEAIHRSYSILKPVLRSDKPGATLSQDKLPPLA